MISCVESHISIYTIHSIRYEQKIQGLALNVTELQRAVETATRRGYISAYYLAPVENRQYFYVLQCKISTSIKTVAGLKENDKIFILQIFNIKFILLSLLQR